MHLTARIKLYPSFHEMHAWSVELSREHDEVMGECEEKSGTWRLSNHDLVSVPREVSSGRYPDREYNGVGLDGISVSFSITAGSVNREKMIWCPERSLCLEYAVLVRWCWSGLYEHSSDPYRIRLEQLHSYFSDWGTSVRRTATGLRLFGALSSLDEPELWQCFNEVAELPQPQIDMSNFEGTGTLLYPVFRQFFERSPNSKWWVNATAQWHMTEAGIPESAMVLAETKRRRSYEAEAQWEK